jgi:hypothetical protein
MRRRVPVRKWDFVCVMAVLAILDREKYIELRNLAWSEAIPRKSEFPN